MHPHIEVNKLIDHAQKVVAEAALLIRKDFPDDSPEDFDRNLKRAFNDVNRSPRAILNAEALRQTYRAFRE